MENQLSIVILAAGQGTRMKSATPKVLHKICGREMIFYSVREALAVSGDVCVVLGFAKEAVEAVLKAHFSAAIEAGKLRFITQDTERLPGTGGALMGYEPRCEKTLVLNGDMPLITAGVLEQFVRDSPLVLSVINAPLSGYGRVVIKKNRVQKIAEEKDATAPELALQSLNAGVYCFDSAILSKYLPRLKNNNAQGEYYLTDIVGLAVADGVAAEPLFVELESFKGVNDKADLAKAEAIMCARICQAWLKKGVIMRLPDTIYIEDAVVLEGECVLENGVAICGESVLKDAHIRAHSVVESSHITDSDIGPCAHIRPGSEICGTHIGNFVEVKKSQLDGVKAGHLSYIGDSEVGSGTNIGAGFITCNYDGIAKHRTKIGRNVFIGSDTQVVAPLEIADNCIIGAGSTLRKGVKSGELVLTRGQEVRRAGFFEKYFGLKNMD